MNSLLKVTILLTFAIGVIAQNRVESAFEKADLTPEVVEPAPKNLLGVKYGVKNVDLGNELTITDTLLKPEISYDAKNDTLYTLMMIDPDAPNNLLCGRCVILHWLVGNIPGEKVCKGKVLASYLLPTPLPRPIPLTVMHRYTLLLYGQRQGAITFQESFLGQGFITARLTFRLKEFIEKYNLGDAIAGNFYTESLINL